MVSGAITQDNTATFRRLILEGFQAGNPGVVDELVAPDLIEHQFGLAGDGGHAVENLKRAIVGLHKAMPDVQYTFDATIADEDTVWTRMTASGTDTGGFFGHTPTGRAVSITVVDIARFSAGKLVEHWGVPDRFALLAQLGHLDNNAGAKSKP
ncbi:ester cyclase [Arthrobacter silvisoli]|uniref:ester cyclase n=1 Tax=Arthrobacter silvisoli TaxID=2291022 RepID=UPI000E20D726|nr:ester cyclase [Arthrobacter silvisoli]